MYIYIYIYDIICIYLYDSAAGLDQWAKKELRWLSDHAYRWLTIWMMKIEENKAWPGHQSKARAVFLCKDDDRAGDPMSYRILKIASTLYRVWATASMKNREEWIKSWADRAHFAGIPGVGPEDAWYLTQLEIEVVHTIS